MLERCHFQVKLAIVALLKDTGVEQAQSLLDEADGLELAGPVRWGTTPSLQGPVALPVRISRR